MGGKNLLSEKIENALKISFYIKEVVVIGDGKKFISVLIQIDADAVGNWVVRCQLGHISFEDLSGRSEIEVLIKGELVRINEV